jgi:5-methylcytosine-specific restriction endonuclease McrA
MPFQLNVKAPDDDTLILCPTRRLFSGSPNLKWKRLLGRDRGFACEQCGVKLYVMIDNRTREFEGYENGAAAHLHHKDRNAENTEWDNLALVCPSCHSRLHHLENPQLIFPKVR